MRKFRVILLLLLPLFVFGLSGCANNEEYDYSVKKVVTKKAKLREGGNELYFTGNLEGKKETVMSSKTGGRIKEINIGIGDEVKKNDLLFSLSGEENYSQYRTATDSYNNSLAGLKNTETLMVQKVLDAESNLKIAEENLLAALSTDKNNQTVSQEKVKDAKLQLELAQINKNSLKNTFAQKEQDVLDSISSAIMHASVLSYDILVYLYSVNNDSLPDEENDFDIKNEFVVKDSRNIRDAEQKIIKAKTSVDNLRNYYNSNNALFKSDVEKLFIGRDIAESGLKDIKDAVLAMNGVVSDSVTHSEMSQTSLDAYRNKLVNYSFSVENMLLSQDGGVSIGLLGARQSFDNLKIEKQNSLVQSEKQIELTSQKIELLESGLGMTQDEISSRVEIFKAQVAQAKQALATAKNYASSQVQVSKTQSDLARGSMSLAGVGASNNRIKAPYDGVVVEKYSEEGVVIGPGSPILKVADVSILKLVVFIPESQIMFFEKGLIATATSDSFPEVEFEAIVERVSPKSEEGSKKVRVEFVINKPEFLKLGMYMKVEVQIEDNNKQSAKLISIPIEAVEYDGDKNYVWVIDNTKVIRREVEIGQSFDSEVEIVNNLKESEEVVVRGFDGLINNDKVEIVK